jgi:hypothetical protein
MISQYEVIGNFWCSSLICIARLRTRLWAIFILMVSFNLMLNHFLDFFSGGSYVEVKASLGGGDGSGHTMDPVMGDPRSGSLAPDLGTRVSVCLPCAPMWILAVCLGADLGGESSTDMNSMGSSSSSSSTAVTPSPPSLGLGDERSIRLDAIG